MLSEEQATTFGTQLVDHVRSLKGSSVGVVLEIADEFATAELKPELDNPAALPELRASAFEMPAEVLDDSSVPPDQASWRVLPYPAAGAEVIGTTITISKRLDGFCRTLRSVGAEGNFPVIVHSLSAPLIAMMGLPLIIRADPMRPFVAIFQYPWFTAMAFFNEHSDLRLIRTLQHRGMRRPANFRHALATTNASLEFVDPDLYVIPLSEDADGKIPEDLQKSFPDSKVHDVRFAPVGALSANVPEPAISVSDIGGDVEGMSYTFGPMRQDGWFLQDFLPASRSDQEMFPSRNEMRMLRFAKIGRLAVGAAALLGIMWLGFSIFTVIRRPQWSFNEGEAKAVKQRLVSLTQERQRLDHWNNLLEDRSKAWTSMEALARLFPSNSGLLLKSFSHSVRPDTAPGQAQVGFTKEWVINGMAREESLSYLNSLNTREGISAHFTEIAKVTGNPAYDPAPTTRTIVVNVKTQENSSFKQMPAEEIDDSDESTYPFTFNLTITQRFESADTLSISAATAP